MDPFFHPHLLQRVMKPWGGRRSSCPETRRFSQSGDTAISAPTDCWWRPSPLRAWGAERVLRPMRALSQPI